MNLVDKFLENVTDEFGNKIDFSNVDVEGFGGTVCVIENTADIFIAEYNFETYNSNLNNEENRLLFEFVLYAQQKMKEHTAFVKDQINTQKSLNNYGKF